ncbi:MAG: 3-deoxy-D-manno-octulosonic acid transferase, partial [Gammaproteobacteria bacterium]|nr:3-deoxy-D-manno-octulosonic acid transferase [Gammaproteobacteria bacterium]
MIYRVITILLWPVFFLYTLKISLRYKSLTYFKQRLGFSFPDFVKSPIWIHCASVGEVNTFLPLLELLQINYPQQHFLITTNTPTGAFIVNKNKLLNTKHCYLPIDTYGSVSRFIKAIKPSIAIVMETELWPLLYQQCHSNHIPIAIINGRLSHKTLNTSNWIKQQYKASLNLVDK